MLSQSSSVLRTVHFFERYKTVPLYFLVVFFFSIDYVNSLFDMEGVYGYLSKSYREILFLFAICICLQRTFSRGLIDKTVLFCLIFFLFMLVCGVYKNGLLAASLDWRDSALPIIFAVLVMKYGVLDFRGLYKLLWFVVLLTFANSILAIYQYFTFDGAATSSWRYNFLLEARQGNESNTEERFVTYQIVRDDNLRSSGLLVSALQYSYLAAISAFFTFVHVFSKVRFVRGFRYYFSLFSFPFFIVGMYVSQVRASLIILLISIFVYCFFVYRKSGAVGVRIWGGISVVVASYVVFAAVLLFVGGGSLDASVLGRAPQYIKAFNEVSFMGYGLGAYRGQFDSYFVYGLLTYGALFLFVAMLLFGSIIKGVDRTGTWSEASFDVLFLSQFVFPSLIAAAVIAAFQHFSGSLYYQVVWFLVFFVFVRKTS